MERIHEVDALVIGVLAVDVAQQGDLGLGAGGELGAGPVQQLDLDGRPQVLRQRVIEAVPDAAGGRGDARIVQALGEPQRRVLLRPLSL